MLDLHTACLSRIASKHQSRHVSHDIQILALPSTILTIGMTQFNNFMLEVNV